MSAINTNKLIAYLTLISGLTLSIVAEYYSIVGLTTIFSAAVIPTIIMGIALGMGKITGTLWLKNNWNIASWFQRVYLSFAIIVLMIITALGTFGFLSKAHSDQSLVSGDVMAKIAVYDEKIKTSRENIDANRKALKQMDEAVDQVMSRSSSETGADKAVGLRRVQQKERARLQSEISAEQKTITKVNEARAPIAAEVRKVEAEVGPLKYIAAFIYGETNESILEKAVTWIIILIIIVFDPLAVMLLIASQVSFQHMRKNSVSPANDKDALDEISSEPINDIETTLHVDAKSSKTEYKADDAALTKIDNGRSAPFEPTSNVSKTSLFPSLSNESSEYIQNEEQAESSQWNTITQSTQISEKDYHAAIERSINETVESVRKGILPFYEVPEEIKEQVKQKLQNVGENNSNNST